MRMRKDCANTQILARSLLNEALCGPMLHTMLSQPVQHWNKQKILVALQVFINNKKRAPTYIEWTQARRHNLPSKDTVLRYWGSRNALLRAACV